jgi:hypothetical protein
MVLQLRGVQHDKHLLGFGFMGNQFMGGKYLEECHIAHCKDKQCAGELDPFVEVCNGWRKTSLY